VGERRCHSDALVNDLFGKGEVAVRDHGDEERIAGRTDRGSGAKGALAAGVEIGRAWCERAHAQIAGIGHKAIEEVEVVLFAPLGAPFTR